jgi:mycothiol synthase
LTSATNPTSTGDPAGAQLEGDVAVIGAPPIPGLRFRLLRHDDYAALATLICDANLVDHVEWMPDEMALRVELENTPDFDPRRQIVVADLDEHLVAYGKHVRERRDDTSVYFMEGKVHPSHRRHGIGRALLRYNMARLRDVAARQDDAEGREFGSWIAAGEVGARVLLESEGFVPVRFGFAMRRPNLNDLPAVALPDGVTIRPVEAAHHRAIFDADNEAFRDHWGHREQREEDFRFLFGHPSLDTRLWRVAWDGDEVAGSVLAFIFETENAKLRVKRGWLERVSVRRPWRRRGLARALIVSALAGLRHAGMGEAMLGVDSENPTGALQLYESLGFEAHDRGTAYRKAW